MKKWHKIALIAVVVIGFFFRFYQLGIVPNGLEWDEVAIVYDSYSLIHTGRDQFGNWFPITFRSLDDYKPPLYNYFATIPIALFGLNEFSVRFPSALFGSLSVFGVYLLVKELFRTSDKKESLFIGNLALLSALFLAISPWHLQFSRAAFEVNLSLTFIIYGVYCFLRGVREVRFLSYAAVLFGLGLFSYHSSRVVIPIVLAGLVFLNFKKLIAYSKKLITPFIILTIFGIAFIPIALSKEAQIRFTVTNFLNPAFPYGDEVDYKAISAKSVEQDIKVGSGFWGKIFHNRRIAFINWDNVKKVGSNYMAHFRPEFLYIYGDAPLHHAPGFGMLYVWDAVFFWVGIVVFCKKYKTRAAFPLLIWMLVAPIPASITRQVPHSVRTELIVPTLHIFTALGFITAIRFFWKEGKIWGMLFGFVAAVALLFNIGYYIHQYYVHLPYELADKWFANRKEVILYVDGIKNGYSKVIVSTKLEQPHVFFLFFLKYNPWKYLQDGATASGGWAEDRNKFNNYVFKPIDFVSQSSEKNVLFVGLPEDFPSNIQTVKTFYYPDGREAIKVVRS